MTYQLCQKETELTEKPGLSGSIEIGNDRTRFVMEVLVTVEIVGGRHIKDRARQPKIRGSIEGVVCQPNRQVQDA
jgi:hypothetical protein